MHVATVVPWLVNVVISELINIHSAGRAGYPAGNLNVDSLSARVA